jgi:hypothetical protein
MKRTLVLLAICLVAVSCKEKQIPNAQNIVDKAIEVSGGENYNNFELEFDFRDKHYRLVRNQGSYTYERQFVDSLNTIKDELSNSGFKRYIDNELTAVADSMAVKYTSSVNSVHYFIQLPFGLNDAAVNKAYIDLVTINNQKYHKLKVTFNQEGGGEDYEDVFVYWINVENFKTEYIAYSYAEDDGLGLRFREAYNERYINGLRFVDYKNYKPESSNADVLNLDVLFEANKLKLLSKIENENITVK